MCTLLDVPRRRNELTGSWTSGDYPDIEIKPTIVDGRLRKLVIEATGDAAITSDFLRSIPLTVLVATVWDEYQQHANETLYYPGNFNLRRPDGTPTWWRHFAWTYTKASMVSGKPAQLIAEQSGVPVSAVYRWSRDARRKGLLPKTGREARDE